MSSINEKVCEVISTQLRKPRDQVRPSSRLGADLEADSLDIVEVVMAMEAEFNLELISKEVRVDTVQDVIDYINAAIVARDNGSAAKAVDGEPAADAILQAGE